MNEDDLSKIKENFEEIDNFCEECKKKMKVFLKI
jgi:hypothetical protein